MFPAVQVLVFWLVGKAYAQHYNQPTQPAQRGVGFPSYPAPPAPYGGGYDAYASNPAQYGFGYETAGEYNNRQFGAGQDRSNFANAGLYGYPDASGLYRRMNYADALQRFRATAGSVGANEPGTAPGVSRDAVYNAAPIIRPAPTGSAQEAAAAAYGARPAAPAAGGYGAYGQPAPDAYARAAGAFDYAPYGGYGGYGYGSGAAALGGQAYGSLPPYGPAGYAAGYTPGVNGAQAGYGSRPATHRSYRRR